MMFFFTRMSRDQKSRGGVSQKVPCKLHAYFTYLWKDICSLLWVLCSLSESTLADQSRGAEGQFKRDSKTWHSIARKKAKKNDCTSNIWDWLQIYMSSDTGWCF